jgi:hypothetical protein
MPPQSPIQNQNEEKLLPPGHKSSSGPIVGIVIIIVLLILGGLYFWGAHLNAQNNPENQLPLIPADNSTTSVH